MGPNVVPPQFAVKLKSTLLGDTFYWATEQVSDNISIDIRTEISKFGIFLIIGNILFKLRITYGHLSGLFIDPDSSIAKIKWTIP